MRRIILLLILMSGIVFADSITLNSPENNARLYDTSVIFSYTPNMNNITKCDLFINNSKKDTDFSVTPNEENSFLTELDEGSYIWQIKCDFDDTTINSETRYFVINTTRTELPDIQIDPKEITKSVKVGFEYKQEITVRNMGNSTAYNITFNYTDDIKFYPNNFNLSKDESKKINMTIKTNETFEKDIEILVKVLYFHEYEYFNNETNQTEIREEYVSDENLFRTLSIHLTSEYQTTTVVANVIQNDVTINTTEKKENAIIIENKGNYTAIGVNLHMENVEFPRNDFSLKPFESTILIFNMTAPPNLNPEDTNKTYTYNLTVKGKNFEDIVIPINIFVPYSKTPSQSNGTFVILPITDKMLEDFCKQFPDKCPKENVTKIVYREKTTPYNFTQEDIKKTIENLDEQTDMMTRIINEINLNKEETNDLIRAVKDLMKNQSSYIENLNKEWEEEREKRQKEEELRKTRNMLFMGSILLLIVASSGFYAYRWWKRRQMEIW